MNDLDDARQSVKDSHSHVGNSMVPAMKTMDRVYVNAGERYRPDDVILFIDMATWHKVVYRVLSVREDGYMTRGDNNLQKDSSIASRENVIGRVDSLLSTASPDRVYASADHR